MKTYIRVQLVTFATAMVLVASGCLAVVNPVATFFCDSFIFNFAEVEAEAVPFPVNYELRVSDGIGTTLYSDPSFFFTDGSDTLVTFPSEIVDEDYIRDPVSGLIVLELIAQVVTADISVTPPPNAPEIISIPVFTADGICSDRPIIDALPTFADGRINDFDDAAPVAVYPALIDSGLGLEIRDPEGNILLTVTPSQLLNAPLNPDVNTLIAEANGVTLYRIVGEGGGLWQINAPQYNGKTYVLIFSDPYSNTDYVSYEE